MGKMEDESASSEGEDHAEEREHRKRRSQRKGSATAVLREALNVVTKPLFLGLRASSQTKVLAATAIDFMKTDDVTRNRRKAEIHIEDGASSREACQTTI